jgi:hypothetical protein
MVLMKSSELERSDVLNIEGVSGRCSQIDERTMAGTILRRGIPLPLAVVDYEGSTVLVSLNGLRLLSYR